MKGRFAPTPSGRIHLGNVFASLLAWLSARSQGGRMVMRIEDLDLQRTTPAFTRQMLDDLLWLGLDWDEGFEKTTAGGPYQQSLRSGFYAQCIEKLQAQGLVYPCFCSRAEVHRHVPNAPHQSDGNYIYNGKCRGLTPQEIAQRQTERQPCLRLRVPDTIIRLDDGCQGAVAQNLAHECGDFILQRSDGVYAYQLAAPADDGAMGVAEVVRGRDLLSSAPRQIWLIETLGYKAPCYRHVPLLMAPEGRRLAKRDADLDMGALRSKLQSPAPLLGLLAFWAGIVPENRPYAAAELVPLFSWDLVQKEDITVTTEAVDALLGVL